MYRLNSIKPLWRPDYFRQRVAEVRRSVRNSRAPQGAMTRWRSRRPTAGAAGRGGR